MAVTSNHVGVVALFAGVIVAGGIVTGATFDAVEGKKQNTIQMRTCLDSGRDWVYDDDRLAQQYNCVTPGR